MDRAPPSWWDGSTRPAGFLAVASNAKPSPAASKADVSGSRPLSPHLLRTRGKGAWLHSDVRRTVVQPPSLDLNRQQPRRLLWEPCAFHIKRRKRIFTISRPPGCPPSCIAAPRTCFCVLRRMASRRREKKSLVSFREGENELVLGVTARLLCWPDGVRCDQQSTQGGDGSDVSSQRPRETTHRETQC